MPGGLADLPPELLDHITENIPTAQGISHFGQTNKKFHDFVEKEGWSIFARSRFLSQLPTESLSWHSAARSLTTLSRAWDRRAYIARVIEPTGSITSYPSGAKIVNKWRRPSAQTMGFSPRLDACELPMASGSAADVLAMSTGAQVCIRRRTRKLSKGANVAEKLTWSTYCPFSAREGPDDVTALHLVHSDTAWTHGDQEVISGTANGDLQHISIPFESGTSTIKSYFATQGQDVQATSLLQESDNRPLLAAALGHTRLALYSVDSTMQKVPAASMLDLSPRDSTSSAFSSRSCRVWTTSLLSKTSLAVGGGPSSTPILLYDVRPEGIDSSSLRALTLHDEVGANIKSSSVHAVRPLQHDGRIFLSGAYDGVVRLHDMRAPQSEQKHYDVPVSAPIYSLLTKGEHMLLAGTARHDTLLVFDMRMEERKYSYTQETKGPNQSLLDSSYALYLRLRSRSTNMRQRTIESSVYSLASSSPASPFVHVGLHNTIMELAFTEVGSQHQDPLHFRSWPDCRKKYGADSSIHPLARYERGKLSKQATIQGKADLPLKSNTDSEDFIDAMWLRV